MKLIVLDTHAWIFLADNPKKLGKAAQRAVAKADVVGVAAISLWELTVLVEKGRISLNSDLRSWMDQALADDRLELLPMTPAVVGMAHQLRGALHGDPGDRLIVATALVEGASLVSKDEQIANSGVVPVVW